MKHMPQMPTLRRDKLDCGEKKIVKLFIRPWGPFLAWPVDFSASSGRRAAQGSVGEAAKVSLEVLLLCPIFFHLFLFSEGYQMTKEGLEKKILCCFKNCWGISHCILEFIPIFYLKSCLLNGFEVYQEENRWRSGPCLSFSPICRRDNAFCYLWWWGQMAQIYLIRLIWSFTASNTRTLQLFKLLCGCWYSGTFWPLAISQEEKKNNGYL